MHLPYTANLALTIITLLHFSPAVALSLEPLAFNPLPLGSITPNGWLKTELQAMAHGLAGHERDFYAYVRNSSWTGGDSEYSELNEGLPYWFNGLVPLAYGLDDERLKDQVHSVAEYVLSHQQSDGWIGPEKPGARTFWGRYPLFLGLTQLVEANTTGWRDRVMDGMHTFFSLMNTMLKDNGTGYLPQQGDSISPGDFQWGRVRSQDMMITLMWLLENDPRNQTDVLIENLNMLYEKGLKWEAWYNEAVYPKVNLNTLPDSFWEPNYLFEHGVNVGQGFKATAVYHRFTHNSSLITTTHDAVNWTIQYHGMSSGTIIGDERLEGLAPFSGAELCTAVETMYSLSYLYQALGTNLFADRCELAAFNALPAMVTPDWWAHQYVQETNQPWSKEIDSRIFYNTNNVSQMFGLEPNYPCCTVNHPQGLPKFLSAMFVAVGDNGLGHALLSPGKVETSLTSGKVLVDCQTNYPFDDGLAYSIQAEGAFDMYIRVPEWADSDSSSLIVNGQTVPVTSSSTTGMVKMSLPKGSSTVNYTLSTTPRVEARANNTVAIYRGPLLYALQIEADTTSSIPPGYAGIAPPQSRDYVMTNATTWNVAIDPSTLKFSQSDNSTLPGPIFAPGAVPVSMTVKACEIDWPLCMDSVPGYAPAVDTRKCHGSVFDAKLIPYGGAKLRMAELPTIDLST